MIRISGWLGLGLGGCCEQNGAQSRSGATLKTLKKYKWPVNDTVRDPGPEERRNTQGGSETRKEGGPKQYRDETPKESEIGRGTAQGCMGNVIGGAGRGGRPMRLSTGPSA